MSEFESFSEISDEGDNVNPVTSIDFLLHDDLLERILAYLPIASIFRAGCVCKRWNEIVNSRRLNVLSQKPWYFMFTSSDEPILWKWYSLELLCIEAPNWFIASSCGLVCFMDNDSRSQLFVCNPIIKDYDLGMEPIDYDVFGGLEPLDTSLPWDWDITRKVINPSEEEVVPPPPEKEEEAPPAPAGSQNNAVAHQQPPLPLPPQPQAVVLEGPPSPKPPVLVGAAIRTETAAVSAGFTTEVVAYNGGRRIVRPDWLPPFWTVLTKVRKNGKRAGQFDKYYEDPTRQYIFKSKKYVLEFLQHGKVVKKRGPKKAPKTDAAQEMPESSVQTAK
ncbi:hypothetical protein NE237_007948 [Protea cynaroides]|uniref:MBD domain-containing protein n=1 Tax=Protea cynaroides TaxID=273540 RepID=A0A9Q0QWZ3_9MAGN|nr:hypothetical protein NE237_007948 [Protea cynaroides]